MPSAWRSCLDHVQGRPLSHRLSPKVQMLLVLNSEPGLGAAAPWLPALHRLNAADLDQFVERGPAHGRRGRDPIGDADCVTHGPLVGGSRQIEPCPADAVQGVRGHCPRCLADAVQVRGLSPAAWTTSDQLTSSRHGSRYGCSSVRPFFCSCRARSRLTPSFFPTSASERPSAGIPARSLVFDW